PSSAADLQTATSDPQEQAVAALAGPGGPYVVIWGIKLSDLMKAPAGASGTILGYEAKVPTSGGVVLLGDASTRIMDPAEFNATPNAAPARAPCPDTPAPRAEALASAPSSPKGNALPWRPSSSRGSRQATASRPRT